MLFQDNCGVNRSANVSAETSIAEFRPIEQINNVPLKKIHVNKRLENKRNRNLGLEYSSKQGKIYEKRDIGLDCICPKKCYERVNESERKHIFNEFWKCGNYDIQNAYLHGRIQVCKVKRRYTKNREESRRNNTVTYTVLKNSQEIVVCKKAFLNIHGLQKSRGRIEQLVKKIAQGLSMSPLDKRGLHQKRPNKFSNDQQNNVIEHINQIPKYQSHYSRKDNPNKVYVGHEYTLLNLYEDFRSKFCKEKNVDPVSFDKYRKIFRTLNISFKHPKSDTCKTCDTINLKIKQCRLDNNSNKLKELQSEQELHHRKAEVGLEIVTKFRKQAKEDNDLYVYTFDLQQALPLPKLSVGPAFYRRKIWGYNISVHDCKTEKGFFYFWDEPTAGRGSEEIASCLKKHFEKYNIKGERLVVISDNCGGQNKNWCVVSLWSYLVATGRFKSVTHYFPVSGHTLLPSDQDFGHIESYVRRHVQDVYTPEQWVNIIEKSCNKSKFSVTRMESKDFLSWEDLKKKFTFRNKDEEKQPVRFAKAVSFSFSSVDHMKLKIRHTYHGEEILVNLTPRGQPGLVTTAIFPKKYSLARKIDQAKMKDLTSLQNYIPLVYWDNYYGKLSSGRRPEGALDEDVLTNIITDNIPEDQ